MTQQDYFDKIRKQLEYLSWISYTYDSLTTTKGSRVISEPLLDMLEELRYRGVITRKYFLTFEPASVKDMKALVRLHLAEPIYDNMIQQPNNQGLNNHDRNLYIYVIKITPLGKKYFQFITSQHHQRVQIYRNYVNEPMSDSDNSDDAINAGDDDMISGCLIPTILGLLMTIVGIYLLYENNINGIFLMISSIPVYIVISMILPNFTSDDSDNDAPSQISIESTQQKIIKLTTPTEGSQRAFVQFMNKHGYWKVYVDNYDSTGKRYEILRHRIFRNYNNNEF